MFIQIKIDPRIYFTFLFTHLAEFGSLFISKRWPKNTGSETRFSAILFTK
jgi:hypothetical protein